MKILKYTAMFALVMCSQSVLAAKKFSFAEDAKSFIDFCSKKKEEIQKISSARYNTEQYYKIKSLNDSIHNNILEFVRFANQYKSNSSVSMLRLESVKAVLDFPTKYKEEGDRIVANIGKSAKEKEMARQVFTALEDLYRAGYVALNDAIKKESKVKAPVF